MARRSPTGAAWKGTCWRPQRRRVTPPPGGVETLYTFASGADNALYERHSTDGVTWTSWLSLGGQVVGPPASAGVPEQHRLYVVTRWRDNAIWVLGTTP